MEKPKMSPVTFMGKLPTVSSMILTVLVDNACQFPLHFVTRTRIAR